MLRGLLAHKLRLVLSSLAVVLGTMFMSGAFVGGDTLAAGFDRLFTTVNANLDVQVTAKSTAPNSDQTGLVTNFVPQAVVDTVSKLDGVASTTPEVVNEGARMVGKNGKVIGTSGPPRLGIGWTGSPNALARMRTGNPPSGQDQIAINAGLANTSGYGIGDRVDVITPWQTRTTYTIVGIFGYEGGRDTLGGETSIAFTMPVAQHVMLGQQGVYTNVNLTADSGVSPTELKNRVAAAVGPNFDVKTGKEVSDDQASQVQTFIGVLKTGLTVFALIGLFTGAFLIFNTFSMLVAQRTRELALYRAFGAGRGQVNRAVLLEAVLLGLFSAVIGLLLGLLVGWLLKTLLVHFSHASLPISGIIVHPYVVISTLLVGVVFTVVAALAPALRASRVPPIAAMRDAATPDKSLVRLTVSGAVVFLVGAGMLALKLTDTVKGQLALLLGGGAVLAFIGVAMLAPSVARPVTAFIGKVFGRGAPGRLGVRNTGRNPRRTAITAAALTIGVALATGAGVFAESTKAGISDVFRNDLHAQLAIMTDQANGGGLGGFEPADIPQIKAIPGVTAAVALQQDIVNLDGRRTGVAAAGMSDTVKILDLRATSGALHDLGTGEMVVDETFAKDRGISVGQTLTMQGARGGPIDERVVGIYAKNKVASGPIISAQDATAAFRSPLAQQGYVQVADNNASASQLQAVHQQLDAKYQSNPEVTVSTTTAVVNQASNFLDTILTILNILLALTILVAVLGVINTLLLSIYERTREIGLIRAIGMGRGQTGRMITVESILISVFGALIGIVIGVGLGVAIVAALRGSANGFLILRIPWSYLVITLVLAVIAGVVAAVLPAIRAARLNVLAAIAYE
jgi:putative ABC transport system permease protein